MIHFVAMNEEAFQYYTRNHHYQDGEVVDITDDLRAVLDAGETNKIYDLLDDLGQTIDEFVDRGQVAGWWPESEVEVS